MPGKITAYQASDGQVFLDRKAYKAHEQKFAIAAWVKETFSFGSYENGVVEMLQNNAVEITKLLRPLVKAAEGGDDEGSDSSGD